MTSGPEPTIRVTLGAKQMIADQIVRFELVPGDGVVLPPAEAGAHINVRVPDGQIRKYSLCQGPETTDRYIIVVKREQNGKGGSISLIDDTVVGSPLLISAPVNNFALKGNPSRYVFIAGGIGITPIYSMIQTLLYTGTKPFKLYYLTRNPEQTALLAELKGPDMLGKVVIHHDEGDPDRAYDLWPVLEQPKGAYLYCCGPRGLMESVRDMSGHWSPGSVHFEDFGKSDIAHRADNRPFAVRIAGTDERIEVNADNSILEALRERGYRVPSSCESGTCGTCRCTLVEGKADHRDLVLTTEQQERFIMICVSRAAGNELVIGLPE